jgi:UDP-N-acetylmuramoyl-tripeptide--D-alanyl-D-alanine ligase
MVRTLASVAQAVHGRLLGPDAHFGAVSTDTRQDVRGTLFVALTGGNFDGNDYLEAAAIGGAAGALVSRPGDVALSQIAVADTRKAFGQMARSWRSNFEIPVVAVTGSSGKTTVKSLIASILGSDGNVCATEGNLNNDVGVPITLMRLGPEHSSAVLELGANHAGEIDVLASLVQPTVAVITNAGAAHLEGFGSIAGVAAAKGELLDHLAPARAAILNADDAYFEQWRDRARTRGARIISFGFAADSDCTVVGEVESTADGSAFRMRLPDAAEVDVRLPLPGLHNVRNALAAAAASCALGISAAQIKRGLAQVQAVKGRLVALTGYRGARIIDDSYNANPSSVRAALDHLARLGGRRLFAFGDMGELGPDAEQLHREVGTYAIGRCDALFSIGPLAARAAESFGAGATVSSDIEHAAAVITPELGPGVSVLVKASRSMGLERLVQMLRAPVAEGESAC